MKASGIRLFEMAVLGAVMIACAGLVYPVVKSERMREDRAVANEQCRLIAVALNLYLKDRTGEKYPVDPVSRKALDWLKGPGKFPANNPFGNDDSHGRLCQVLKVKDPNMPGWNGPYLENVEPDPWGHAYLVNTGGYHNSRERVWILSAGPNGIVETPLQSSALRGDDIGRILR